MKNAPQPQSGPSLKDLSGGGSAPAFKIRMGPKRPYLITKLGNGIFVEPLRVVDLPHLGDRGRG